ncbi:MAG: ABC transporter permease, partial [Bacteroidales bacterium]
MSSFKLHFHISNRLLRDERSKFSRPIVNLSIIGVALGLIIMILSVSITSGYKNEIRNKVIAMGSHIRISNYDMNYSFEPSPISRNQFFIEDLKRNSNIQSVQYYCTKVGIVKTDDQVEGIVLKGIDTSFLWDNFAKNIVEGNKIELKEEKVGCDILISRYLAQKLKLKVGDKVRTYFVQDPPMQRSFVVTGIYETGMPEFDKKFALVDLRHVQKLNNWDSLTVGGIEILIRDYDRLKEIGEEINGMIGYHLKAETIRQIYPEIFEWIDLFDTNVIVLMLITVFVCII